MERTMPSTRTTRPIVTGTSILAVKFADGIAMMSDTLGSYGGLARFFTEERLKRACALASPLPPVPPAAAARARLIVCRDRHRHRRAHV